MTRKNTLDTAVNVVNRYIDGDISKPMLRAWTGTGYSPVRAALGAVIEVEQYRHLKDFLFMTILLGVMGTMLGLMASFTFFPIVKSFAYGIALFTAAAIIATVFVHRTARSGSDSFHSRHAQDFIEAHDSFVHATKSLTDERFTKLKFEELRERAHLVLAECALSVREIEIAGKGISAVHWEARKKGAALSLENMYKLMRRFTFVGDEGYKPYYDMAEEILKKRKATA